MGESWTLNAIRRVTMNGLITCLVVMVVAPIAFVLTFKGYSASAGGASENSSFPLVAAGGFLVATVGLVQMAHRLRRPETHPALRWPQIGTPNEVAAAIDAAMNAGDNVTEVGHVLLTPTWLVSRQNPWQLRTMPVASVVWVHIVRKTQVQAGIPTSQTLQVKIHAEDGQVLDVSRINVSGTQERVDAILSAVAAQAPWAEVGYTPELEQRWRQDRAAFLRTVAERRSVLADRGGMRKS